MSCQFNLKTSYFFFRQRSKYLISCLKIATFSIRGDIRIFIKFSKMLLASILCHFPRMNTSIFPGSGPPPALFTGRFRICDNITYKQMEEIPSMPGYVSFSNPFLSRIISLKINHTKSQTTVSLLLPSC
jgi:hypothetical protein